ncbi:cold-shock protein [Thalassorhabdomicrobium marinisediminis]|uniref:Cold-shock protein n=1 Tax=Thalassorhabdomicrobium marinisediminis TaxID=2170577 RepID=A0A2T7G1M6_9RHOB|nr:cold shock protein [Thalassorhabdomicrobium marinisediminis]PVA08333.1 cold-shock protein [Thalassorhabdomicrobium marinisediminis]
MQDLQTDEYEMVGHVKWFDPGKGFGFIVAQDGGPDILLHANVLRNFGQSSVADGTEIEVRVIRTDRGLQASEVLHIPQSERSPASALADFADFDPAAVASAPAEPARVKWFDKVKGFGFANVFGSDADVFVHIEVLRLSGLADLLPGEAIAVRVIDGKRGLMAAEVLPWEIALSQG